MTDDQLSASKMERLLRQFRENWNPKSPPSISTFVEEVVASLSFSAASSQSLLEKLIAADIELRFAAGESVSIQIYSDLGADAVAFAERRIAANSMKLSDQTLIHNSDAQHVGGSDSGYQETQLPSSHPSDIVFDSASNQSSPKLKSPATDQTTDTNQRADRAGREIGPYKLLQKVGEGGMGEVWMAEQREPVQRRVALKIIRADRATELFIARFEAERQALAMMNHPNIARVYDAGKDKFGSPYLVMELVQGIPITDYCDQNKLTPERRLRLFEKVCLAVQHAHQKGIIHRDLKPANVLVCIFDGEPTPKVIDFGLAKAHTSQIRLTDKTLFTEFGQVVGTIQYMSPEQAVLDALDIDTRSDVYSLGVMLYELLIGSTPVDQDTLEENALFKVLEMVREKDPPKPSVRFDSSTDNSKSIGGLRQIAPRQLQQMLKGELDWIVMKALEKDRTRRYDSASALAQDVNRFLSGDTIEARPPTLGYRFGKYVRKNRGLVASLAVVTALLIAGISGSTWFAIKAQAEKREAVAQRNRADSKVNEAIAEKKRADAEAKKAVTEKEAQRARKNAKFAAETAKKEQEQRATAEANLAQSNFFLAKARWESERVYDARQFLNQVPRGLRNVEWYLARHRYQGCDFNCYDHYGAVKAVVLSPDGGLIASASLQRVVLHDAFTGRKVAILKSHKKDVTDLCFSPDGVQLATASNDGNISVWDVENKKVVRTLKRLGAATLSVAFSPDGELLASGSVNGLEIWNAKSGELIESFKTRSFLMRPIRFSPDGSLLATGGDRSVILWDTRDWSQRREIPLCKQTSGIAFSPDGTSMVMAAWSLPGTASTNLQLVDVATGKIKMEFPPSEDGYKDCCFSHDGSRIAATTPSGEIRFFDVSTGRPLETLLGHMGSTNSICFSADDSRLISAGEDHCVKVWDARFGTNARAVSWASAYPYALDLNPDESKIVVGSKSGSVVIVDRKTGLIDAEMKGVGYVVDVCFSPDGKRIASSGGKVIRIWDAETYKELDVIYLPETARTSFVIFSSDGKRLIINMLREVVVRDFETGETVHHFSSSSDAFDMSKDLFNGFENGKSDRSI